MRGWAGLPNDESGKGALKLALTSSVLGIAAAAGSPAFQANPLFSGPLQEIHRQVPATFDTITHALGG